MTLADLTVDQLRDEFIGCGWKYTHVPNAPIQLLKGMYRITFNDLPRSFVINRLENEFLLYSIFTLKYYKTVQEIEEELSSELLHQKYFSTSSLNNVAYGIVGITGEKGEEGEVGITALDRKKERNVIKTLMLFIMTVSLCIPFFAISFCYTIISRLFRFKTLATYFYNSSFSFDQTGNTVCCYLFNDLLIKPEGFRMGNFDETISHVLGHNIRRNTLYPLGKFIANTVDFFAYLFGDGKNHCVRASYISQNNTQQ